MIGLSERIVWPLPTSIAAMPPMLSSPNDACVVPSIGGGMTCSFCIAALSPSVMTPIAVPGPA